MGNPRPQIDFQQVVDSLLDTSRPFSPHYLPRFSDLERDDLQLLKTAWPQVATDRRLALLVELEELAEIDTLVNFDDIGRFALRDPDPTVRAAAIRLLWEDQNPQNVPAFIDFLENDSSEVVRAAAATALGLFVYIGELEEIPEETLHDVEESLLGVMAGDDTSTVRRHALESLGFSSREEVPALIQAAYDTGDRYWVASSLYAMGRSVDKRWSQAVLSKIDHHIPEIQFEAVRAAGHLELIAARQPLLVMLEEDEEISDEVRAAAIWSLSQIGGEEVRALLEQLIDLAEEDDDIEYLEAALENLEFTDNFPLFDMFDFDEENRLDNVVDLDEDDETDDDDLT